MTTEWTIDGITVDALTSPPGGEILGEETEITFYVRDSGRYEDLRDYLTYADAAEYRRGGSNRPLYSEKLPEEAPVESLVVPVTPGTGLRSKFGTTVRGIWGVIIDGEDATFLPGVRYDFSLELFVLGYVDADGDKADEPDWYQTREAVSNELQEAFEVETV